MSYCNPNTIDDYYGEQPKHPGATPDNPIAPPPPTDGPLGDPNIPGNTKTDQDKKVQQGAAAATGATPDPYKAFDFNLQKIQSDAAATVAALTNDIDQAIPIAQDLVNRFNAIGAITNFFDNTRLGKYQTFGEEANAALDMLNQARVAIFGTTTFAPETAAALNTFKNQYIDPITRWTGHVGNLMQDLTPAFGTDPNSGEMTLNIDLSDADGSLTDLVESLAGVLDGIGAVAGPWKGATGTITTWARAGLDIWKNALVAAQGIDDALAASEKFLDAAQTVLLAACEAIPALYMQLKHMFDSIWALLKMLPNFHFSFPNITGVHFKMPEIPLFKRLGKWAGIASNLEDSLGATMAKCLASWQVQKDANGVGSFPAANMGALQSGLDGLKTARESIEEGKRGIGKTTGGVTRSMDTSIAAWEMTKTLVGLAPNPSHILPEHAADLAGASGATVPSGVDPAKVGDGKSAVDKGHVQGPDGCVPNPHQQADNRAIVAGELCGTLHLSNALGSTCIDVGITGKGLGAGATEAIGRLATSKLIQASQICIATKNLAVDNELKNQSNVSRDHALCDAADRASGDKLPPTTEADMKDKAAGALEKTAGLPNSLATIAEQNTGNIVTDPKEILDDIVNKTLPASWFTPDQKSVVSTFLDPTNDEESIADIPFMLLCRTEANRTVYLQLKQLSTRLELIRNNTHLAASHSSMRLKAIQQGYHASSPYVWLADGLDILSAYRAPDGSYKTLLTVVSEFLTHQPADIRPLVTWLRSIATIDFEVPFPSGLTEDPKDPDNETEAANASYAYVLASGAIAFSDCIITLRRNADQVGKSLGYEYILGISVLMLMQRIKAFIAIPDSSPSLVAPMATQAKAFTGLMTHGKDLNAMLDVLEEIG